MLNHFLTKLLDHESCKSKQHIKKRHHIEARRNTTKELISERRLSEGQGSEDTLLFLLVLLPSLIVAPGNTHAAEETVACCKNGQLMQVEEAKQSQGQLFVFYKQRL